MVFNLDIKFGKYICIHCKENFKDIPDFKQNEYICGYQHCIVDKDKLKKIILKR